MSATETLKHEHQVILLALTGAEAQAEQLTRNPAQATALLAQMADFFRNFADRCHHAKEENLLFPLMEERGIPREGGPLGVMYREHEEGRAHVRAIFEALPQATGGNTVALAELRQHVFAFVDLLREHIDKEDHCLYAMADQALSAQDQDDLQAAFDRVEAEEIGEGVHEHYHELAHQWAALAELLLAGGHEGGCSSCGACCG